MIEADYESQECSENKEGNVDKMVPVAEAIKYRKRAQSAERSLEELNQELQESQALNEKMAGQLEEIKKEKALTAKLSELGAKDLEAAIILAKEKIRSEPENDIEDVVCKLRQEKGYLFGESNSVSMFGKTYGVRDKDSASQGSLERAAKQAAVSGKRRDLQEYLRMRRRFK